MEMDVGPTHHRLQNLVELVETGIIRDLYTSPNRRSDLREGDLDLINDVRSPALTELFFLCRLLSHLLRIQFLPQVLTDLEKREFLWLHDLFFTSRGVSARVSFILSYRKRAETSYFYPVSRDEDSEHGIKHLVHYLLRLPNREIHFSAQGFYEIRFVHMKSSPLPCYFFFLPDFFSTPFTASLRVLAARNLGNFLAGIFILLRVRGFTPFLAFIATTLNVPSPEIWGIESRGGKEAIKLMVELEFFDCYDCEYRPQRVVTDSDDELEGTEPGQLVDITTDEEMVKWIRDQLSKVEPSVSIVEPEKE